MLRNRFRQYPLSSAAPYPMSEAPYPAYGAPVSDLKYGPPVYSPPPSFSSS